MKLPSLRCFPHSEATARGLVAPAAVASLLSQSISPYLEAKGLRPLGLRPSIPEYPWPNTSLYKRYIRAHARDGPQGNAICPDRGRCSPGCSRLCSPSWGTVLGIAPSAPNKVLAERGSRFSLHVEGGEPSASLPSLATAGQLRHVRAAQCGWMVEHSRNSMGCAAWCLACYPPPSYERPRHSEACHGSREAASVRPSVGDARSGAARGCCEGDPQA